MSIAKNLWTFNNAFQILYFVQNDNGCKLVYHSLNITSIVGNYSDQIIVEFKENIPDELYQTLDSLIATKKTKWHKNGTVYEFRWIWGGHMPAPKGEDDEEERFLTSL